MVSFRVEDMTCGHCAGTIAKAIAAVDKDATLEVSIPEKLVRIASSAPDDELASAIAEAGYTPQRVEEAAATVPAQAARGCCCGSR